MAKPLQTPPPSSSIARLVDLDAAARAVADPTSTARRPAEQPLPPQQVQHTLNTARHDRPCLNREFVLTPSADAAFERLLALYRRSTRTRLTASHVFRAVLKGIAHHLDTLEIEAERLGPLRLPSNARGRDQHREHFEARIADAFVRGMVSSRTDDSA
jgi:hypothetical protein